MTATLGERVPNTFLRFLFSGGFNTAVTYALYLLLLLFLPYWLSYSIAFAAGIVLAYFLGRYFVFGRRHQGSRAMAFPLIYLAQYGIGLAIAYLWVTVGRMPAGWAPLLALTVTIPMTYVLIRWVFQTPTVDLRGAGASPAPSTSDRWLFALRLVVPSGVIVGLLWLAFGFRLTGLIEEWDVLGLFAKHGLFFIADSGSPLAAHSLRPLTVLPHALAYFLDPDSFTFWHLLLISALLVKGAASTYLGWRCSGSWRWGIALGMLVLLWPADTMQLSFRSLHINAALALLLLAVSLSVAALYSASRSTSMLLAGAAGVVLLASASMYEAGLTLLAAPLLIVMAREGVAGGWRRAVARPAVALAWIASAGLFVAYAFVASRQSATYQGSVTQGPGILSTVYLALPKLFTVGALRGLLGGWVDAASIARQELATYWYVLAATAASLACLLGLGRRLGTADLHGGDQRSSLGHSARLAIAGGALMLLGYAPYLISGAHLAITQRTYLYATPGAALVCVAALMALSRRSSRAAGATVAVLLFLGFNAQLYQFHHYTRLADRQRGVLRAIVENFDGRLGDKTLLILDGSNQLAHTWMLRDNLKWALGYLYARPINSVEICLMPGGHWQRLDAMGRTGSCVRTADGWTFTAAPAIGAGAAATGKPLELAHADVVELAIAADGTTDPQPQLQSHRNELAHGNDSMSRRYRNVLQLAPAALGSAMFGPAGPGPAYRWDFGRWWSLEDPTRGSGWREADWQIGRLRHNAMAWSVSDKATLQFRLAPQDRPYRLAGQFGNFASPLVRENMQIRINGNLAPLTWQQNGRFTADVPLGSIRSGTNTIEFNAPTIPEYYGLSAMLDWFEVRPN
jgi:putative flippase GtrA